MQEQQPTTETITLHSPGSIPGIGGEHGPGRYIVDWLTRTITPIVQAVEAEIVHIEEAIHPGVESAAAEPAPPDTETLEHISEQVQQEP